jgi:hypothetical protein
MKMMCMMQKFLMKSQNGRFHHQHYSIHISHSLNYFDWRSEVIDLHYHSSRIGWIDVVVFERPFAKQDNEGAGLFRLSHPKLVDARVNCPFLPTRVVMMTHYPMRSVFSSYQRFP